MMDKKASGKILEVNLTSGIALPKTLDSNAVKIYIGGLGLCAKILYDEVGSSVDPLSEKNIVAIAVGPLSGTTAPTNGRTTVITKSPLNGSIGNGNFGGWWGPRLKHAGFEGVVIRGQSVSPVYLFIDDDTVKICGAEHLWGKDAWQTTDILKEELGEDVSVLAIGQAGENLVKFACPIVDYDHASGRCAAGCVMGAKKIKAIAVRGTKEVNIAKPQEFKAAVKEITERLESFPQRGDRPRIGSHTGALVGLANAGLFPCNNFQQGTPAPGNDIWKLPDVARENSRIAAEGYGYHCPMAKYYGCNLRTDIRKGPYAGTDVGGYNFGQPTVTFSAKYGIEDWPAIWKLRELFNRFGMDEISDVIPFAMELYERGIVTKEDLGGLELNFGNEYATMEMISNIAYREGFGGILAEGIDSAAKKIGKGAGTYALTTKGMAVHYTDPRVSPWSGVLGNMVGPRGDDLNTTHAAEDSFTGWARQMGWSAEDYLKWYVNYIDMFDDVKAKVFGSPPKVEAVMPGTMEGKAQLTIWFEKVNAILNSLGLCLMSGNVWEVMGPTHYAKLYSAYLGEDITPQEMVEAGDRIYNLMKAYAVREGFTRKDDSYPDRFFEEPKVDGVAKGVKASMEKIDQILDEYYEGRGWDKERGVPTKKILQELGLDYVAEELSASGLIPN